jgi:hypothetical protein
MKKLASVAVLLVVTLLMGCATTKPAASTTTDLSGSWQLTLPAGFQDTVAISREGIRCYRLWKPGLNINGIYEVRGDHLVMVVPNDPRLTEFVWHIDDADHLTLVEEPPASKTGASYRTATLKRRN